MLDLGIQRADCIQQQEDSKGEIIPAGVKSKEGFSEERVPGPLPGQPVRGGCWARPLHLSHLTRPLSTGDAAPALSRPLAGWAHFQVPQPNLGGGQGPAPWGCRQSASVALSVRTAPPKKAAHNSGGPRSPLQAPSGIQTPPCARLPPVVTRWLPHLQSKCKCKAEGRTRGPVSLHRLHAFLEVPTNRRGQNVPRGARQRPASRQAGVDPAPRRDVGASSAQAQRRRLPRAGGSLACPLGRRPDAAPGQSCEPRRAPPRRAPSSRTDAAAHPARRRPRKRPRGAPVSRSLPPSTGVKGARQLRGRRKTRNCGERTRERTDSPSRPPTASAPAHRRPEAVFRSAPAHEGAARAPSPASAHARRIAQPGTRGRRQVSSGRLG
ncbi:serine/arginine repetitive matrix protein 1 [Oryctolagus cuniculus]|uniref:serine/arginine repetitive matrix protein 1 n=1 Tax=Oryctolagus cuniculus TaxID=9986 RepID=UPI003879A002